MELGERIRADMKSALKTGDAKRLSVLRMVISEIKQLEIDKNLKAPPAETDIMQILSRQIKQHKESIEQFKKGNRPDLADKEASELSILESYMPAQMSEDEVVAIVKTAISETGAIAKSETGKVMKAVMEKARGRVDGKTVNQIVMKLLK
jgi:uncharacterized protein YqeY